MWKSAFKKASFSVGETWFVMNLTSGDFCAAKPSITVCRHFGVGQRKESDVALWAVEPGITRPAVVLPWRRGWTLVSALWAERRREIPLCLWAFEPGATKLRPSQCGAEKVLRESPGGGIAVPLCHEARRCYNWRCYNCCCCTSRL